MNISEILASLGGNPEGDSNIRPSGLGYVPQDWQQIPDTEALFRELMSNPESHPVEGPRRGQPRAMLVGNYQPPATTSGYPDPGDTGGRPTFSPTPEQQAYSPGRDALSAYLQWRAEQTTPDPTITDEGKLQYDPNDTRLAELGMGATGPLSGGLAGVLKKVVHPDSVVTLQSFRGAPEKLAGEIRYVPGWQAMHDNIPPYFESIWSESPKALGELLRGLEKELGPELNRMELSAMVPKAVPFWESVAKNRRVNQYPDLVKNILEGIDEARNGFFAGDVPERTYGYARGKGNPFQIE